METIASVSKALQEYERVGALPQPLQKTQRMRPLQRPRLAWN
jgi:hypothetical protein